MAGETSPQRKSPPRLPSSYRGLVNAVQEINEIGQDVSAEFVQERSAAADLRNELLMESNATVEGRASHAMLGQQARTCRQEAADLWFVHEGTLREQESFVTGSVRAVEELQLATERGAAAVDSYQTECHELRALGVSLRRGVEHLQDNHAGYGEHLERATQQHGKLLLRRDEFENAFGAAQENSLTQIRRRSALESEMNFEEAELRSLQRELSGVEGRFRRSASDLWAERAAPSELLAADILALRRELQQEEHSLEGLVEESAACRHRALRSESGLLALRGRDVPGGLRELKRRCDIHVAQK